MAGRLQREIQRRRPFERLEEEAFLNCLRTADALLRGVALVLKPTGLSPTQYNVLRILRGAGAAGLACRDVATRMVTREPDVTRLLDRLEERGLVARARDGRDRRVVHARITLRGRDVLRLLDPPLADLHRRQLGHLGEHRLRAFVDLLELARQPEPPPESASRSSVARSRSKEKTS